MKIAGHIVDVAAERIFDGVIEIRGGRITTIHTQHDVPDQYILPGFVDAHVHVESSMVVPSEFARMAVVHGTVATVSDPHEIANVMGVEGVEYMIRNGNSVPFKFFFGAPSCVPATPFETAGDSIGVQEIETLMKKDEVKYLAEMMNWPGVLSRDETVMAKIGVARRYGKVIDGHAPGLIGEQAFQYASAGISTDHECCSREEALSKLGCGMKILIREGSAARNFEALISLLHDHPDRMMFCSDDKHPDSLEEGHINQLVIRALSKGIDLFKVLKAACINPVVHYKLDVGLLRTDDPADFIVVDNLRDFKVLKTFINGECVAEGRKPMISPVRKEIINRFHQRTLKPENFQLTASGAKLRVIEAMEGQLVTGEGIAECKVENGFVVSDPSRDVLKIAVVNRYHEARVAIAFVRNFNLKQGAIASSVAHDSHNIIVVGTDDLSIARAANLIMEARGGVSVVDGTSEKILPLPVAGLMSDADGYEVAKLYKEVHQMARDLGSTLPAPFMTLSFMALLVIPSLKLSDKGLFNGNSFCFADIWAG